MNERRLMPVRVRIPTPAPALRRRPRRGGDERRDGRRRPRRPRRRVARASPAPDGRRRPAAQLRQPLPERRGRAHTRGSRHVPRRRRRARDRPRDRGGRRSPGERGAGAGAGRRRSRAPKEEIARYSRHLIMPEVTIEGQRRLKRSSVLLVGAGGLGSPGRALPDRRRRGADRHRGLRRRGREQPAAPDPPRHELGGTSQAGERYGAAHRPQSPRARSSRTPSPSPARTRSR